MTLFVLDSKLKFPPVGMAGADGLLAIGGDLSLKRILMAYKAGIFPWYEGDHILWWSPDPRFVLFPGEIIISRSMKQVLKKENFRFTVNKAFDQVISKCKTITRKGQKGTWISDEVKEAYTLMHQKGYAQSAETWLDDELVGGLYGLRIGKVFFGESMFSLKNNASKFAFINHVKLMEKEGVQMIDCQVYTPHLESLGARMIPRKEFIGILKKMIPD